MVGLQGRRSSPDMEAIWVELWKYGVIVAEQ